MNRKSSGFRRERFFTFSHEYVCKERKLVSEGYFLLMGYINVAMEFGISMHRVLILNLLLSYKDEKDMLIYLLLTSAQNYTSTGKT